MFIHHVLFYAHPGASAEELETLRTGIESLTRISSIRQSYLGTPADTDRPVIEKGYAFSWLTLFEDAAGEAQYQVDPIHLEFIEKHKHLWSKVVIYDAIG